MPMKRVELARFVISVVLIAVVVCICLTLVEAAEQPQPVPAVTDAALNEALALAGANRPELEAALAATAGDEFNHRAMRFMLVSLPVSDLGSITAAELTEHLTLAREARERFAYGRDYSDATWAHYVLPPRVSQEPRSEWRSYFYRELADLVADAATIEEAAVAVNYWCGERVRFEQTQRRDQGPLTTLKSGYGRCEEMMIVFITAARAVGIPARNAYVPYWSTGDNNHAWVEVFGSDGRWHFTGGCEPKPELDQAWFGGAVHNAPVIMSMCFGLPADMDGVLRHEEAVGARYAQVNSIGFYRDTSTLSVTLPADAAVADENYRVTVHVFNFGCLRPVARFTLDAELHGEIELGAGTYVLSTDAPVADPFVMATVPADGTIKWAELPPVGSSLLLHFPPDPAE